MALEDLGLAAVEAAVYRALVAQPAASLDELAQAAGAGAVQAAAALRALAERGLASRRPGGDAYSAAPPAIALGAELAAHRERLHRAELAVAELVETYRSSSTGRDQRELVEIVEGADAVRQRYTQLQLSAQRTIDVFSTGSARAVGPQSTQESTVLARSLRVRAIIDQAFLLEPDGTDNADRSVEEGVRVRIVEEIPLKLILCDGEVAMLPLTGRGAEVDPSLVLRGGLVYVVQALFDTVWERARPYHEPHQAIGQLDTHILRMLLAGLTDTAVAGQLDLSTRTVQRRLQALMAQAGVTTRMQLGWHARHHGWA
ncbi:hypothetical protein JGS39_14725 [Streptomyces sp. P01-B04]|uniref:helix-turn-helix domain-containing protein n=1 Tax=Streptomyces poriferorum TaxID=2798799 RepID=UPI001C5FE076|nr:helix-turn-helix domain-containing protein [Streptomyces poriferorum]MBW5250233.1 hypothetical protein [Streptomyces poriferorum]MBW5259797.1 hypothetical protein [Streptomyces poriferorum]